MSDVVDIFLSVFCTIAIPLLIVMLPILLTDVINRLLDINRRRKHPIYFDSYDRAVSKAFERAAEYNKRKEYFDYKFKLYNDGLCNGECTEEYYREQMAKLMVEYKELCFWFRDSEKEINELLRQADLYAKEHGLSWGVLYDGKCRH
jgi:hypothetical protein